MLSILAATQHDVEARLIAVLIQLAVIVGAARVSGSLFRRMGQPAVVGEIVAGLILGPSLLGRIPALHGAWTFIFQPHNAELAAVFDVLKELGLIFLLFLIGLEFDFAHLKGSSRAAAAISIVGVAAPFGLGVGLAIWMHRALRLEEPIVGFVLFIGTAMSITAIPILGRIMMEMGISRTRLGSITITSAAIDDAMGWVLLATVSALVQSRFRVGGALLMVGGCAAFAAGMILIVRPSLKWWIRRSMAGAPGGQLGLNTMAVVIIAMFLCAIATAKLGIFAIFGAFLLGAILSDEPAFCEAVAGRMQAFVTVFFLPIFFTYTGLRTQIGALDSGRLWFFAAMVTLAAVVGKFGGCALAARLSGFSRRESASIGVMMNTRALMELIVINVGLQLKVIPPGVFVMLVFMAVLTTVMTSPILTRLIKGTELEPLLAKSGFRALGASPPSGGDQPVVR